jgi:hypothetical protein
MHPVDAESTNDLIVKMQRCVYRIARLLKGNMDLHNGGAT